MRVTIAWIMVMIANYSAAQTSISKLTEDFAFNVKSIDDFIERFDFYRGTDFERFFVKNYPLDTLTREKLLLSLFNYRNRNFQGNEDVISFIQDVTDSLHPKYIFFSDSSWYAELECRVKYNANPERLRLIMRVEINEEKAMKWSIVTASASFLGEDSTSDGNLSFAMNNAYMKSRMKDESRYFLHPVSHALGFMNIDVLFSYRKNEFEKYIYDGPRTKQLQKLVELVQGDKISFIDVKAVSYHFLQIDGWVAIVDYFNREEMNSGWLINTLFRATNDQKKIYLKQHLHVASP